MARGALVGFLFALTVGVWPAGARIEYVNVTNPAQNQVLAGIYESDGTPKFFDVPLRGNAKTDCNGFSAIKFIVTGPSYSNTWNLSASSTKSWSGGPASPWNTRDLKNGVYTVRIEATEAGGTLTNPCENQTMPVAVTAKLANRAVTPTWIASPSAASDGSAKVTFSWKKNAELDVVEYHVTRTGPGGDKVFSINATNPGTGCSLSGTTYSCTDPPSDFPNPYGGTYTYSITAMRSRPDYNSAESPKTMCVSTQNPCVESASSDEKQVTLVDPTPTPTPSPSGDPSPGTTPTPGGRPTVGIGTPGPGIGGGSGSNRGTSVLGGGFGGGSNPFFSGSYEERLPYTPKSLIIGNGTSTPDGNNVQAGSVSAEAPNYRTVMLPVAGGLLAFLSAAHVRRLLLHF